MHIFSSFTPVRIFCQKAQEQNDIYKDNLPNLISKYLDNDKTVDLLNNYVSQNKEVTQEIVSFFYDGLNPNKPEIKGKYISIIEKMYCFHYFRMIT